MKTVFLQIFLVIILASCRPPGGSIPVYNEPSVHDVESRYFELEYSLEGNVIKHQQAYHCSDSSIYNSTTIISTPDADTITVYAPCFYEDLPIGSRILITPIDDIDESKWHTNRQIFKKPKRKDSIYPYWKCVSCEFSNTRGRISSLN